MRKWIDIAIAIAQQAAQGKQVSNDLKNFLTDAGINIDIQNVWSGAKESLEAALTDAIVNVLGGAIAAQLKSMLTGTLGVIIRAIETLIANCGHFMHVVTAGRHHSQS